MSKPSANPSGFASGFPSGFPCGNAAAVVLIASLLAGCALAPPAPQIAAAAVFHDELFVKPAVPVDPSEALAMSPAMRAHVAEGMKSSMLQREDRKRRLVDALYRRGDLHLEYDSAKTRTASQAYDARVGNCLSLVLMTAAFAKELGLTVRYQVAVRNAAWNRRDELYISLSHVNLTLAERFSLWRAGYRDETMTIDFVPGADVRSLHMREIDENTVVAMYLNNRAVESLTDGDADAAYWYARAAVREDPELMSAYTTLAVVFRQRHRPDLSEQVLLQVTARQPQNTNALANLVVALRAQGRDADAEPVAARLARLDPEPPFADFNAGMAALREERYEAARDLFAREAARDPEYHEFQFWLAIAYLGLSDRDQAAAHLARAVEVSTTRKDRDLYAGKLEKLRSLGVH